MWLYYDKNVEGVSHHTFQFFSGCLQVIFIELAENVIAISLTSSFIVTENKSYRPFQLLDITNEIIFKKSEKCLS